MGDSEDRLVSVFKTEDPGLLPLAKIALESAGIEYQARSSGKVDNLQWTMSQAPTNHPFVIEILVAGDEASRASDLLADLNQSATVSASDPAVLGDSSEPQAVRLEVADTGLALAAVTEEQLQWLGSHLEEIGQQQYLVDHEGMARLRRSGANRDLVRQLDQALGDADSITLRWMVG